MYDPAPFATQNKELQSLELSTRAYNALSAWKPDVTIQELAAMPEEKLLCIPGLGRRSARDIREMVEAITGLDRAQHKRLHEWVDAHKALVQALVDGEAVIVPLSVMRVGRLEVPR